MSLGRAASNTLSFPEDPLLSKHHLRIEPEDGRWVVVDCASKNGVRVNGELIQDRAPLLHGDVVVASGISIRFEFLPRGGMSDADRTGEDLRPLGSQTIISTASLGALPEGALAQVTGPGRRNDAVWAFFRVGQELSRRRPLPELFRVLLGLAIEASGAERGMLLTIERSVLTVQASSSGEFPVGRIVRERVLVEGKSLLVEDVGLDDSVAASLTIVQQGVRSLLAVPLQTNERIIGMIYLESSRDARRFTPDDLHLLTVISYFAGILIEREQWEVMRRTLLADNANTLQLLAAALSHEINSPLGTLKSTIDVLFRLASRRESAELDESRLARVESDLRRNLDRSLDRMSEVIGRIQRFTNLDRADVQEVDLNVLVLDILTLRLAATGEEPPGLQVELGDIPPITCRPLALNTAFSNLVDHALASAARASDSQPAIRVSTIHNAGDVSVVIWDNGPQVSAELAAVAFDPSFQVEGERMAASNWDLFTARSILREQGGDIRFSPVSGGNEITVQLPVRAAET